MSASLSHATIGFVTESIAESFEEIVDSVVTAAFERSGGICECSRRSHGHLSRCAIPLVYNCRGQELPGGWEALLLDPFGYSDIDNCEIVCISCYKTILGK